MLAPPDISKWGARLRIGTCSWKYDTWQGLVYNEGRTYGPYDYLADYARYFNTVEIDQWFWSLFASGAKLPSTEAVRRYAESVPDDFRFSVKVPNAITLTHHYARQPQASRAPVNQPNPHFLDVSLLNRFLETLAPMHEKLGPLVFQFEYINKQKMPSLQAFIDKLDAFFERVPQGFVWAVETRNPNYLQEDFVGFLRRRRIALVLLEGYYMPHIWEVPGRLDVRTAPVSIVRLHGPDRTGIEEQTGGAWDKIVAPKDEDLSAVAEIIRQSLEVEIDAYVNVNNHYEGCGPLTIQRLLERLPPSPDARH